MEVLLSIATFITSLVSLLTLYEMVKQRRASMLPNILLKNKYILFLKLNEGNNKISSLDDCCPYTWSIVDEKVIVDFDSIKHNSVVDLVNVGNGTATNIRYEWNFDVDFYLNEFNIKKDKSDMEIKYYNDKERMNYSFKKSFAFIPALISDDYKISFMQPSEKTTIDFSKTFMFLFSSILYLNLYKNFDDALSFAEKIQDYPYPELIIRYNDISGKEYKKIFKFKFSCGMLSNIETDFTVDIIEK